MRVTQEEKAEWLIYVTDEGQAGHFKLLFGAGRQAGIVPAHAPPPRIDHVGFGLVLGADGKRIRTRDSGAVRAEKPPSRPLRRWGPSRCWCPHALSVSAGICLMAGDLHGLWPRHWPQRSAQGVF